MAAISLRLVLVPSVNHVAPLVVTSARHHMQGKNVPTIRREDQTEMILESAVE